MRRNGRTDDIAFNICGTESASENTLKMTDQKEDDELGKFKIIFNEMQPDMSEFMLETVSGAMRSHLKGELKSYNDVAGQVKKQFQDKYKGAWHVIVGAQFGSFVTHETSTIAYVNLLKTYFLIFKHG